MKQHIREQMLLLRKQLNQDLKQKYDQAIVQKIRNDQAYQDAHVIGIYMPMRYEINILDLLKDQKTFVIPKVEKNDLKFYIYNQHVSLTPSTFGVLEPKDDSHLFGEQIDYMIVPALAISKDMYRIGYGKGFYDRYLIKNRPKKVVGVIYPFQYIESFKVDEHDQALDQIFIGDL